MSYSYLQADIDVGKEFEADLKRSHSLVIYTITLIPKSEVEVIKDHLDIVSKYLCLEMRSCYSDCCSGS